jgi:Flp pilus assembly protein TadD
MFLRTGNIEAAIVQLASLVLVDQNDADAALLLASLLHQQARHGEAWLACETALQVAPFRADVHGLCGRIAIALERWADARIELELEVAAGAADEADTRWLLQHIYEQLGSGALLTPEQMGRMEAP